MRSFGLSLAAIIILSIPVYADYHYASHNGSNTYPYTSWESAADSITSAMNAASPYDTIYIGAGEYDEVMNMGAEDSCKAFIGAGTDSTHCWTSQMAAIWYVANKTVAQDIWFTQTFPRFSICQRTFGMSVIVRSCKFVGDIGIFGGGDSVVVENCQFIDCVGAVDASAGVRKFVFRNNYFVSSLIPDILFVNYHNGYIENNICYSTYWRALGSFFAEPGYCDTLILQNNYIANLQLGPIVVGPRWAYMANNTVNRMIQSSYGESAYKIYFARDSVNVVMRNNAAVEVSRGISTASNVTYEHLSIGYTGFWKNLFGNFYIGDWTNVDTIGNIDAYPMFVNPDSHNVHLQAYSPLIDAGDPNILDVDGTRSDIGVFGGPGGCSYVYLDLAPQMPDSLVGRRDSSSITLTWRYNYEADFNRYQVFKDTLAGFTPSIFNMIAEPETSIYLDNIINPSTSYYYRITSVDNQGNISDYSNELSMQPVGLNPFDNPLIPQEHVISSAYPNPFNSNINIVYSASNLGPQPPEIKLLIYDITGRVVRTLVDEHKPCGTYRVTWDGKDDGGISVSSGTYIVRLYQWGMSGGDYPVKITLVK